MLKTVLSYVVYLENNVFFNSAMYISKSNNIYKANLVFWHSFQGELSRIKIFHFTSKTPCSVVLSNLPDAN